jgi:hypothetical protein
MDLPFWGEQQVALILLLPLPTMFALLRRTFVVFRIATRVRPTRIPV